MNSAWLDKLNHLIDSGLWVPIAFNIAAAGMIILVGFWLAGKLVNLINKMLQLRNVDEALRGFLGGTLSAFLKVVVLLAALEQMGMDTTSLLAVLGAAGLAIGLALKDSLSNFAAGIMLILFKPFTVGDYVEVAGIGGVIERISIFSTLIHSPDNKAITVPNAQVYGGVIVNYSAKPTRRIDLVFGIGYGDDMKKARALIADILAAETRILADPQPVIAVAELGDSSVNLWVRPWVKSEDYWDVRWSLIERVKTEFDGNGISIPFPQRDVHLYQASE